MIRTKFYQFLSFTVAGEFSRSSLIQFESALGQRLARLFQTDSQRIET